MNPPRSLVGQSAAELAGLLKSRALSAEEVARAFLARIAEREPVVQAFAHFDPEHVLAQARALDAGPWRGPPHGLPVAIKDIIATADLPTEYGSPIYRGHRPAWDAACVAAIRASGGIIAGKSVTTEFASSHPGKTVHPHDPARTPGGSSSGSAAAVADFMVPLALGTQTGGSVIRPASFCGIVGYKPSFGLIDRHGVKPLSASLDTIGAMARDVAGVARLVAAVTGRPALQDLPPIGPPRIGVWRTDAWQQAAPETIAAIDRAIRLFGANGARVSDAPVAPIFAQADTAHHEIEYFEMARALAYEMNEHAGALSAALSGRLQQGARISPERYDETNEIAAQCRRALAEIFADYDVLLLPSAVGEAPLGHASTGSAVFNRVWTLFHNPAVTLPASCGPNGMPIGIQLIGRAGGDRALLAASAWAERALGPTLAHG